MHHAQHHRSKTRWHWGFHNVTQHATHGKWSKNASIGGTANTEQHLLELPHKGACSYCTIASATLTETLICSSEFFGNNVDLNMMDALRTDQTNLMLRRQNVVFDTATVQLGHFVFPSNFPFFFWNLGRKMILLVLLVFPQTIQLFSVMFLLSRVWLWRTTEGK